MELAIIALYLVAIFGIGIYCNKFNNNIDDYLLAGRRLGVGLTTFTLVATYFGGGYVIGVGGEAFNNGLSAYWSPIAGAVGILAGQVTSAGSVLASLGVGSTTTCAIIVAVFFIGFTAFGGLWAVTVTDFIQIIIAGVGLIAATIFVVVKGGGWDIISTQIQATNVPDNYFSLLQGTEPSYVLWLILPMFIYTLIGQDVYQRLFAAKDTKTAYKSAILAFIILLVICFFPVILGMAGRALFPELEVSSLVVPTVIRAMLPPVFSGFTLAAIIAAVVSTADSILTAATSHVVNDLYVRYFCKDDTEDPTVQKKLLDISRLMTLVIGVISVVVALAIPSVLMVLNSSYTLFTAGVFSPVVAGLLWKKATKIGAFAGLFSGLAFVALGWSGFSFFGIPSDIASSLLSLVVLIVVSLITYKPETAA